MARIYTSRLLVPFQKLEVITAAQPSSTYNYYFLDMFTNTITSPERYNKKPFIWRIKGHSSYAHISQLQRLAKTMHVLANNRPFEINVHARNISPYLYNPEYDNVFMFAWINGLRTDNLKSVCYVEYIKDPLRCSETANYIKDIQNTVIEA